MRTTNIPSKNQILSLISNYNRVIEGKFQTDVILIAKREKRLKHMIIKGIIYEPTLTIEKVKEIINKSKIIRFIEKPSYYLIEIEENLYLKIYEEYALEIEERVIKEDVEVGKYVKERSFGYYAPRPEVLNTKSKVEKEIIIEDLITLQKELEEMKKEFEEIMKEPVVESEEPKLKIRVSFDFVEVGL